MWTGDKNQAAGGCGAAGPGAFPGGCGGRFPRLSRLPARRKLPGYLRGWRSGPRGQAGFTLLEMAISMAIFSLMISMAFQISMVTTRSASEKLALTTLQVKGERTLKLIVEALTPSAQLGVDGNGTSLSYYAPVDLDGNGTPLRFVPDPDPTPPLPRPPLVFLEYGAVSKTAQGTTAFPGTMRFEYYREPYTPAAGFPNVVSFPTPKIWSEANERVDLNGDGDRNDVFDVSCIAQMSNLPGDLPSLVGVTNILQRQGNYGASIIDDSNPASDTSGNIFYLPPGSRVLQISLWLATITEDRIPHLINCRGQVFLRNQ